MSKLGEGVHSIYKERASKGGDVLWYATIKGQNELAPGIPLHMSLKVFADKKEINLEEIKEKVKKFDIKTPDPKKLSFKTTIFTSERDGNKYYMLLVNGVDKSYSEFYDSLKHCGTVYNKFMSHVTIDKGLYDKINEEGLTSDEVEFSNLSVEAGSGNTIHEFNKSEDIRETIRINDSLKKHIKASYLSDKFLFNYFQDNPQFEKDVIKKHEHRLSTHFGNDLETLGIAWKQGIEKAYEFLKNRK